MNAFSIDVAEHADSPAAPPGFEGVVIASAPRAGVAAAVVRGAFRLSRASAEAIDAHRHRALVVVASSAGVWQVATPCRERVFFDDDEETTKTDSSGWFNFLLGQTVGAIDPGKHFVFVSMGAHVSNVLTIDVEGSPHDGDVARRERP